MYRLWIPFIFISLLCGCAESEEIKFLSNDRTVSAGLPFSEGVIVDDIIYLSGQIGTAPGTIELVPGGIGPETRQTMENIKAALERHGSSMDKVFKCLCMVADMSEWPAMNEEYVKFFPGPKPARSAFGSNGLALDARVEIECWATID